MAIWPAPHGDVKGPLGRSAVCKGACRKRGVVDEAARASGPNEPRASGSNEKRGRCCHRPRFRVPAGILRPRSVPNRGRKSKLLRSRSGFFQSKLRKIPFAVPLPEGSSSTGLRESGFGFGLPRRLALLPGCPTSTSMASTPKDLRRFRGGGTQKLSSLSGRPLLTAKPDHGRAIRFAPEESACG